MKAAIHVLGCLAVLWLPSGCGEVCQTGETCARACPPGGAAICAAHGLCACLPLPDGGTLGDGGFTAGEPSEAGAGPAIDEMGISSSGAPCPMALPGDLVINELMLDGEPTEDAEFVELVNTSTSPIAMAGVRLTSNRGSEQVRRVEFSAGCLPVGAALAVFQDRADWIESSPADPPLEAELRSFGFANGGDFDFRLMRGDMLLDRLSGAGDSISPGISLNRSPDREGPPRAHDLVDPGGAAASPGRCPGGGRYEDDCLGVAADGGTHAGAGDAGPDGSPSTAVDLGVGDVAPSFDCEAAAPGELRINEVLIDGEIPRTEADEFVEVVNIAPASRSLREVALAVEGPEGESQVRVRFGDGCLPPWGVMVLRPDPDDWVFAPEPSPSVIVDEAHLALGNETPASLVLLGPGGAELDRFDPSGLPVVEGVSLNRSPELEGEEWVLHDSLVDRDTSPGRCRDGQPFADGGCPAVVDRSADGCIAPTRDVLVINEVLVDGVEAGEADEFVELVNRAEVPLALDGLALWSSRADGELVERVAFERGCLPPGALAVFGRRDAWIGGTPDVVARVDRLALPNEATVVLEVRIAEERWSVEIPRAHVEEGVSLVREVDGDPGAPWVLHDTLAGLAVSPGQRSDGAPFVGDAHFADDARDAPP